MVGYVDWINQNSKDLLKENNREIVRRFEEDLRTLKQQLDKDAQHIMLLSLEEAQGVIDDLLKSNSMSQATTYAGNIKDAAGGAANIVKLISYKDAGKIFFTLKGLGIKAIQYSYGGKMYVKITGYPSLRRILNGTRYRANHPKLLELGIGKAGVRAGIISGARFCIWFSACWRLVELIFRSDHDVAAFLGNITMDMAKVIVTIFVTEVAVGGATLLATTLFASLVVPVWGEIVISVVVGYMITRQLYDYDVNNKLSTKLIECIRDGIKEQQEIDAWNNIHSSVFSRSILRGDY